jgi:hypothetical protein
VALQLLQKPVNFCYPRSLRVKDRSLPNHPENSLFCRFELMKKREAFKPIFSINEDELKKRFLLPGLQLCNDCL